MWLDLGDYHGPSRFHAFVMYSAARRRRYEVGMAYKNYVTESLRLAPQGMAIGKPFHDMLLPRREIDVEGVIDHIASVLESG